MFSTSVDTVGTKNIGRKGGYDALRIFATYAIMFHHWQQVTGATFQNHINFWGSSFYWGYIVELFFVLSGFFCAKQIKNIGGGSNFCVFYLKKLLRFLPVVAIAAVTYEVILVVYAHLYQQLYFDYPIDFFGVLLDTLCIQHGWGFADPNVNYPTWYISVLMLCYVAFYIVTKIAKQLNAKVVPFYTVMILIGVGIQTYGINLPFFNADTGRGYYAFFTGILLGIFLENHKITPLGSIVCVLNIVVFVGLIAFKPHYLPYGVIYPLTFVVYPSIVMLLSTDVAEKIFKNKIWTWLGTISFDVYVWHNPLFPLMFVLMKALNFQLDFSRLSFMYLYSFICIGIGAISYYVLNKPSQKVLSKILKRDRTGVS